MMIQVQTPSRPPVYPIDWRKARTMSNYAELRRLIKNAINAEVAAKTARYHARRHEGWSDPEILLRDELYKTADTLDSIARDANRLVYLAIDPELYEDDNGETRVSFGPHIKVEQAGRLIENAAYQVMCSRFTHW